MKRKGDKARPCEGCGVDLETAGEHKKRCPVDPTNPKNRPVCGECGATLQKRAMLLWTKRGMVCVSCLIKLYETTV